MKSSFVNSNPVGPAAGGAARGRGLAMVMVMIALSVGTIIVLAFLSSQTTSMAIAHNSSRQTQARAIAEDAVALVMEHLRGTPAWRDDYAHGSWSADQSLGGGMFRAMFEDETDTDLSDDVSEAFTLTVEGSFDGVVHRTSIRVVPEAGDGHLCVMVVTGDAFHADEDLLRIAQIKAWGYTTVDVADSDSQAVYDAAAALADVIYVSEEAASSSVGTKLNGYTIGVVNEEQALQDELKMASSGGNWSGTTIDITDNTHPITAGFALGDLQITENVTGLIQSDGTPAAGLHVLAERLSSTTRVLTCLDVGDTMTNGNPSPQRRVTLPFGSNAFEYGQLNDDGRRLMKQAIDWAADSPAVTVVNPISRWTLDETAGSLAADVVGGHHGSYETGTTLGAAGQVDHAVEFDGSSGHVEIDHDDAYLVDEGAITAWFYLDNTSGRKELFSKDSSGYDTGGHVTMYANGSDVQVRFQDTSTSYELDSGSVLSASTWHHAALTFGPDGLRLYVDSVLVDSDAHTGGMGTSSGGVGNYEPIALGANTWSSGNLTVSPLNSYLDGRLDDVRYYGEQLTAEQVAAVFTSGEASSSGESSTTPELVALYEFIEPVPVTPQRVAHWKLDESAGGSAQVAVGGQLRMRNTSTIDSYDSSLGVYASTAGSDARVSTNSTSADQIYLSENATVEGDAYGGPGGSVSTIFELVHSAQVTGTSDVLSSAVDLAMPTAPTLTTTASSRSDAGGSTTVSGDLRYGSWSIYNNTTVTVSGDATVVIDANASFDSGSIVIPSGSSLTLYVGGTLNINNQFHFNNDSQATDRLTVVCYNSSSDLNMTSGGQTAGTFYVGDDVSIGNPSALYGSLVVGDSLTIDNGAIHIDNAGGSASGMTAAEDELGNDGTYQSEPSGGLGGFGDGETSVDFDGVDQFVEIAHDPAYLLNNGTFSFWFRPGDVSGRQAMLSKDATNYVTGGHFRVYLDGSQLECRLQSTSTSYYVSSANGAVSADTWHHVAVGFGAGGLRMYLDGVLVDSDSYTGGLGTSSGGVGNEESMLFGADLWQSSSGTTSGWNSPYHGRIDDVRLYDQNLELEQVNDLLAITAPRALGLDVVEDTSEQSPALDLTIEDPDNITWISGGGLTIDTATSISSNGGVGRLHDEITETDQLTIETVFTPVNITQDGPSRIVSYDSGSTSRNFHINQREDDMSASVRTEFSTDGMPNVKPGNVMLPGVQEHIIVSYDGEELKMYRNGTLLSTVERTGDLDNWGDTFELVLGNVVGGSKPWLGTLHRVAIYDRAVNTIQADNIFNGDPPGDGTGGEEGLAYAVEWLESP